VLLGDADEPGETAENYRTYLKPGNQKYNMPCSLQCFDAVGLATSTESWPKCSSNSNSKVVKVNGHYQQTDKPTTSRHTNTAQHDDKCLLTFYSAINSDNSSMTTNTNTTYLH